jgi:hypothetical protein
MGRACTELAVPVARACIELAGAMGRACFYFELAVPMGHACIELSHSRRARSSKPCHAEHKIWQRGELWQTMAMMESRMPCSRAM